MSRRIVLTVVAALAGAVAIAGSLVVAQRERHPSLPETCARDEPSCVAALVGLRSGQTIAEIGAGSGKLAIAVARLLGRDGTLIATELDDGKLSAIRSNAATAGVSQVQTARASDTVTGLRAGCCDAVYLRFVYHHLTEPEAIDRDLRAAVRPGGAVVVVDFPPNRLLSWFSRLPSSRRRGGHGLDAQEVVAEMTAAGFIKELDAPYPFGSADAFVVVFRAPVTDPR